MHIVKLQLDIEVFEFWSTYTWFFSFYQTMWPVEAKVRQKNCNLTDYINNTIFTKSLSWPMWKSDWVLNYIAQSQQKLCFLYTSSICILKTSQWQFHFGNINVTFNLCHIKFQKRNQKNNCGFVNVFVNFKSIFNYI